MPALKFEEAMKKIREAKPRNFVQTVELIITLRNIDLRKPENRFTKEIELPHGRGKEAKVCVMDKEHGFTKEKIEEIGKDKKEAKKLAKSYDFFLASAELMPTIGKALGRYLAPRGKMPTPIPPTMPKEEVQKLIEKKKRSVIARVKLQPQVQVPVGTLDMSDEQIKENVEHVVREVIKALPKGRAQLNRIYIKATMTPAYQIEVRV